jgi:hypothetical protein
MLMDEAGLISTHTKDISAEANHSQTSWVSNPYLAAATSPKIRKSLSE